VPTFTRPASEAHLVALLQARFSEHAPAVRVGIGDDAAVLAASSEPWVLSVDTSVDGVHFDQRWLDWEAIGYRSFQAAASDLAAMGARPVAALSSLIVPAGTSLARLDELTRGQRLASVECACPVVGGNLSRGGELSVTTTVAGAAAEPLRPDAARVGDELWLVGRRGLAPAGLSWLRQSRRRSSEAMSGFVEAWRRPRALLDRGRQLVGRACACIDVSDGLAADAARLAAASRVAVVVDRDRLRRTLGAALLGAGRELRRSPLAWALSVARTMRSWPPAAPGPDPLGRSRLATWRRDPGLG
jgi:thiamine-monophosphate kinase